MKKWIMLIVVLLIAGGIAGIILGCGGNEIPATIAGKQIGTIQLPEGN